MLYYPKQCENHARFARAQRGLRNLLGFRRAVNEAYTGYGLKQKTGGYNNEQGY